jgi:DNA-binding XRE family transcriptional regulator
VSGTPTKSIDSVSRSTGRHCHEIEGLATVLSSTFFLEVKMANIAGVLRDEISRLSRREIRKATESTKKATNQHRRAIAMLKSHISALTRQVLALTRTIARFQQGSPDVPGSSSSTRKIRFVAKGLRANRTRLGLSAGEFGRLVGVSANSVYAWEAGTTTPRREQLTKIAALRTVGKRDAAKMLAAVGTSKSATRRRR